MCMLLGYDVYLGAVFILESLEPVWNQWGFYGPEPAGFGWSLWFRSAFSGFGWFANCRDRDSWVSSQTPTELFNI